MIATFKAISTNSMSTRALSTNAVSLKQGVLALAAMSSFAFIAALVFKLI